MTISRFRERAKKLRAIAERLYDKEAREILLGAARSYSDMASATIAHQTAETSRNAALTKGTALAVCGKTYES